MNVESAHSLVYAVSPWWRNWNGRVASCRNKGGKNSFVSRRLTSTEDNVLSRSPTDKLGGIYELFPRRKRGEYICYFLSKYFAS